MQISLPIARPPWTQLGKKLESMCRKAIYEFQLLDNVDKLAIALSGGKDSLTLLFLMKAILGFGVKPIPLIAIHVGGEFSCGAGVHTAFLQAICKELEVTYVEAQSTQTLEKLSCYPCSRERRKLIFDLAKQHHATTVAFGHHREDSIQTLLLNLLHKGEFAGNLAKVFMEDYGVTIIRPLLYICENAIREFASLYGFARTMCQCPFGQTSMRKKVAMLIEEMERIFPNVRGNLAQASLQYGSKKALKKK